MWSYLRVLSLSKPVFPSDVRFVIFSKTEETTSKHPFHNNTPSTWYYSQVIQQGFPFQANPFFNIATHRHSLALYSSLEPEPSQVLSVLPGEAPHRTSTCYSPKIPSPVDSYDKCLAAFKLRYFWKHDSIYFLTISFTLTEWIQRSKWKGPDCASNWENVYKLINIPPP